MIAAEGKSTSGFSGEAKLMPLPTPAPQPEPDRPADSRPAILPVPSQDLVDDGYAYDNPYIYDDSYIYGGIYIRHKTGEILELDQMEQFFSAEWRVAEKEWERLRQEAGKLDVGLYRKLQGVSETEKVAVSIHPTPVETDDLRALFAALREKYPQHTINMELTEILPYYGYDSPAVRGGDISSLDASSGYAVPEGDATVSYLVPNQTEPAQLLEKPDTSIRPVMPNEEYWQEYNTFWAELELIREVAIKPSLASIKDALESMGITYRDNGTFIGADLTAKEINDIAQLPAVATVFEEVIFTTMDGGGDMLLRSGAPGEISTASLEAINGDAKNNNTLTSYLPLVPVFVAVFAGLIVYRRRIFKH